MQTRKMDRNWSWRFWRRWQTDEQEQTSGHPAWRWLGAIGAWNPPVGAEPRIPAEWEARLVERGVANEWAERLAPRLAPIHADLGRGSAEALMQAAVVVVEVQAEAQANVDRNMRDVREVERLLGAFSGELEKLDEVLEVLSAYAQRMRAQPVKTPPRTLH